jgi:hypothetical protein
MFKAIWVSTGKSASATLIHCALHPVVIIEAINAVAKRHFCHEFDRIRTPPEICLIEEKNELKRDNCKLPW